MTKTKRSSRLLSIFLAAAMVFSLCGGLSALGANVGSLTVGAGETVTVTETTTYGTLTIEDGGALAAEAGKSLTLVEGGVEKTIEAGTYTNATVAVTDQYHITYDQLEHDFRFGLYVGNDGTITDGYSATEAISGGTYDNSGANGLMLRSVTTDYEQAFNGIGIVVGAFYERTEGSGAGNPGSGDDTSSDTNYSPIYFLRDDGTVVDTDGNAVVYDYVLDDLDIVFEGPGGNDFAGFGSAVFLSNQSRVKMNGSLSASDITTAATRGRTADLTGTYDTDILGSGQVRTGIYAEGQSLIVADGVYVRAEDGDWIDGYTGTVASGVMKSVPWMLGLYGNNRATNLIGNANAFYVNSIIEAENWGALSTDDNEAVFLTTNNSLIRITGESGYGSYSIGSGEVNFIDSYVYVPDYALIIANGASSNLIDGTVIDSDRFGLMYHSSSGAETTIVDSDVTVGQSLALIKAAEAAVHLENTDVTFKSTSDENVILQLMDNDDAGVDGANGMVTTTSYVDPVLAAGGAAAYYRSLGVTDSDLETATGTLTLTDMDVEGNVYNSAHESGSNLDVTITDSTLTGVISASVSEHEKQTLESPWATGDGSWDYSNTDYQLIGMVENTAYPVVNNGVTVTLGSGAVWNVTDTAYLSKLVIGADAEINGDGLTMYVDGDQVEIAPGTYTGNVVLTVDGGSAIIEPNDTDSDAANIFTDVTTANWYYDAVNYAYQRGLVNGTTETTFSPQESTTRAMFTAILGRLAEQMGEDISGSSTFDDVASTAYYYDAVAWAADNGIVEGYGDGRFGSNDLVTREQMAAMMVRFADYMGIELATDGNTAFTDGDQVASYFVEDVERAAAAGLINGNPDGTFAPKVSSTRAEVTTIFYNFCLLYEG